MHCTWPHAHIGTIRPPKGYDGDDYPRLVESKDDCPEGVEPCPHCLSSPCVIEQPPNFLTGSAAPALGNISKRFSLYRKFWQLLKEIGLWQCETYLQRKGARTARDDPREIIPKCVVMVRTRQSMTKCLCIHVSIIACLTKYYAQGYNIVWNIDCSFWSQ